MHWYIGSYTPRRWEYFSTIIGTFQAAKPIMCDNIPCNIYS